ncbi:hypothetical protein JMUB7514_27800 [Staphylococcus aureus]
MYKRHTVSSVISSSTSTMKGVSIGICLLYTSDAADDSLRVDLGGRRIIKKDILNDIAHLAVSYTHLTLPKTPYV